MIPLLGVTSTMPQILFLVFGRREMLLLGPEMEPLEFLVVI